MPERPDIEEIRWKGRERGKAPSTLRSYQSGWKDFSAWCEKEGVKALPAETNDVCDFLFDRFHELKRSTLKGRVAAIRHFHRKAGYPSPTDTEDFRTFWKGLWGMELIRGQNRPIDIQGHLDEEKEKLIPPMAEEDDLQALRDRALILLGIAGNLRRSELAGLDVEDATFRKEELQLTLGDGEEVRIRRSGGSVPCPARALRRWIEAAEIDEGPLFRSVMWHGHVRESRLRPESVSLIVKRAAEAAGLDADDYTAEDLRQRPAK